MVDMIKYTSEEKMWNFTIKDYFSATIGFISK